MKRLKHCCCCASTRTGTLITASLGIIASIFSIFAIWFVDKHKLLFSTYILSKETDKDLNDMEVPRIILTITLIFTIIICSLLIVAVHKRRAWLMLPFVVLGLVLAIGLLITVLHTSISYYITDDGQQGELFIIATVVIVGGLIYFFVYLYLWAVVFSHYLDVRDEEERGRYRKAPYRR